MFKTFLVTLGVLLTCANAQQQQLPANCAEAARATKRSGIYQIQLKPINNITSRTFFVYCELDPSGGDAWTLIQRRQDGAIDFYRKWADYKYGFGNLDGEFWLGLENIHALTQASLQELWVQMEDFNSSKGWAKYDAFAIGSENQEYALNILGKYSSVSNGGDGLRWHQGMKFSARDKNNSGQQDCPNLYTGGWWFNQCLHSDLNGQYLRGALGTDKFAKGVVWHQFRGLQYSLKYTHMAIRPRK